MIRHTLKLTLTAGLLATGLGNGAAAQDSRLRPGWSFELAPYAWLPTFSADLRFALPPALGGSADVRSDAGDYGSNLNAAVAFTGAARYDRFTLLTDFMYVSAGSGGSRVEAVDIAGVGRNPISSTVNRSGDTTLRTTLWTLAGGYTVAQGAWGHFDVLAGFRYLGVESRTDYNIAVTLVGPRGNAGPSFGGAGRLSARDDIWNGIVGVRGRVNLGQGGFFVPYYVDLGAGDSNFTWQMFSGLGYQTGWAGVQLGWRYMSYDQGGNAAVQRLTASGLYLAVNFSF